MWFEFKDMYLPGKQGAFDIAECIKTARKMFKLLKKHKNRINVMFVGAAGSGKKATIRAMAECYLADAVFDIDLKEDNITLDVGEGSEIELTRYQFCEELCIYDTPDLGGENDRENIKKIRKLFNKKDADGKPLIDVAVLVFDLAKEGSLNCKENEALGKFYCALECKKDKERLCLALNHPERVEGKKGVNLSVDEYLESLKDEERERLDNVFNQKLCGICDLMWWRRGKYPILPIPYSDGEIEGEEKHKAWLVDVLLATVLGIGGMQAARKIEKK